MISDSRTNGPADGREDDPVRPGIELRVTIAESNSAEHRFQDAYGSVLAVGIILSVALHLVLFLLLPQFRAQELQASSASMEAVDLPPEVEIPPPPKQVARPAMPTVAQAEVSEDVTIAPTTFEANPTEHLPPPPKAGSSRKERPTFIPHDVEPRLENREEIFRLLQRFYPRSFREAGIGGTVTVWVYVNPAGAVENAVVKETSGYDALDEAAVKVAHRMEFTAALNHGEKIGVWASQRVRFRVVDR